MKFMLQLVPTVPASPVERERLRPIAHRTEKIQQMLDEMVDLAQLVEGLRQAALVADPTPDTGAVLEEALRVSSIALRLADLA